MPVICSYYQIYKSLGLLHVKMYLEFLKLYILFIVYSIDQNYVNAHLLLVTTYYATHINCGNAPEARDGYFTTYYSFNKIVLDIITEKFDIQVDENTKTQAALLHDDIPGYDLPTIDFVQTATDNDEDVSILEEDNSQIHAHLDNVLVHMIDNQQAAIFKSKQDFNKNILNIY